MHKKENSFIENLIYCHFVVGSRLISHPKEARLKFQPRDMHKKRIPFRESVLLPFCNG